MPKLSGAVFLLFYRTDECGYQTDRTLYRTDEWIYPTHRVVYQTDKRLYHQNKIFLLLKHSNKYVTNLSSDKSENF